MAKIIVRDPFHDVRSVVRHAFDDPFFHRSRRGGWNGDLTPLNRTNGGSSRALALDVYEDDGVLHVEAQLAGFSKDDVSVTLERGKLAIRAEHAIPETSESDDSENEGGVDVSPEEGRRYFVRERRSGSLSRSLLIGDSWDADSVGGTLENGVLKLTIAKSVEAQPRTIEIS